MAYAILIYRCTNTLALSMVLRDAPQGVDKVMGALCRLRTRSPRRPAIPTALADLREHRHRMPYAPLRAQSLPIGSGVVEVSQLYYPYTDT